MKNIQNLPEKVFFTIINLLLASGPLIAYLIGKLSLWISLNIFNADPINSENDWQFLYGCIILYLIYIPIKFALFPILYALKKQLPFIHCFFDKFLSVRLFTFKILFLSLMLDVFFIIIDAIQLKLFHEYDKFLSLLSTAVFFYSLFGFGLFGTYLTMFLWSKFLSFIRRKKTRA